MFDGDSSERHRAADEVLASKHTEAHEQENAQTPLKLACM